MTSNGSEFQVNTQLNKVQEAAQITALSGGGFVAVWQSNDGADDGSDFGIKAQIYDSNGVPTGDEFLVNTQVTSKQISPSVAAIDGGGFVVSWHSNDGVEDTSSYGIKAQVFSAAGSAQGGEFLVNTKTGSSQVESDVIGLDGGGFVIAWKGDDDSGTGIRAQLYGSGGSPEGEEFILNTETYYSQEDVKLAALAGGGFVATWSSRDREHDSSSWGVKAQIFDGDGQPSGDEFLVNTTTNSSQQGADVVTLSDGGFVVVWRSSDGVIDTSSTGIRAQMFDADGTKRGDELQVNSEYAGSQNSAAVAALSSGGFVVTWRSADGVQDSEGSGIKAQIFDAGGVAKGGEFLLNQVTASSQTSPAVAGLSNDRFVGVWTSSDDSQSGVSGRIFAANTPPEAESDSYTLDEDGDVSGNVLDNDADADGENLTAVLLSDVDNGTLVLNADGSFTYTPKADFNGTDSFTYAADDGSGVTSSAVVTLTVASVNDAPDAQDDTLRTNEDKSASGRVLTNDSDLDGDALSVSVEQDVAHGTLVMEADGRYTYTPDAGFFGLDGFTYLIDDGNGGSATASVTITVNEVNFAPIAGHDYFDAAQQETISGQVLDNDSDPDGDALSVSLVYDAKFGTLDLTSDGGFIYTPDAGFSGLDRFIYEVSDGKGGTDRGTVRITVDPENYAPVAEHDYVTIAAGGTYGGLVLDNDFDQDGDTLTVSLLSDALSGSLVLSADGAFSYVAADGFSGKDRFTYQ
ncbi:MAG: tandem-95 repeat protein, partial [Rhodobacteraceae bacterium]|nr:tandem-95 repeat protein [Paracoccaceae bacterium]